MNLCVIENLTLSNFLKDVIRGGIRWGLFGRTRFYYIDLSPVMKVCLPLAAFFGFKAEKLDFRMIDLRDERGDLWRLRIAYEDLPAIQRDILASEVFQKYARLFSDSSDALRVFFEKQVACFVHHDTETIWRALVVLRAVNWANAQVPGGYQNRFAFLNKRTWSPWIKEYAEREGIVMESCSSLNFSLRKFLAVFGGEESLRTAYYLYLKYGVKGLLSMPSVLRKESKTDLLKDAPRGPGKLMVEYHASLNLRQPECHSDAFFAQVGAFDYHNVVFSVNQPAIPLTEEQFREIEQVGAKAVALNPRAVATSAINVYFHQPYRPLKKAASKISGEVGRWFQEQNESFRGKYAYWSELFQRCQAKIFVTWYKFEGGHCPISQAMRDQGGVFALYQRSLEEAPCAELTAYADVFFGFSKFTAALQKDSGSKIPYFVVTGYLGDHRAYLVDRIAGEIRNRIMKFGAQRIIAFFDENSVDDHRWHTGHEFMRKNYEFLFCRLLEDRTLGLVLKPKVPANLPRRLGPVAELLEKARQTGRCYVFESGMNQGSYTPIVAAKAADFAIHGHLVAATAGLESALGGVPTLMLDREGWSKSYFHRLEKGKVVFTDWDHLWAACGEHWRTPGGLPGFGDWGQMLDEMDPFRDGKAASRMGTYLTWLMEGFQAGQKREDVLARAAERYAQMWGKDKIIPINV